MSKVYLEDSSLTSIANAIRTKGGTTGKMTPAQMATAIGNLSPQPNLGTKTITENGTYTASSDSLDGYSSVNVNVASSGGGGAQPINLSLQSVWGSGSSSRSYDIRTLYPVPDRDKVTLIYANTASDTQQATGPTEILTLSDSTIQSYLVQTGGFGRAAYMQLKSAAFQHISGPFGVKATTTSGSLTKGVMYITDELGDYIKGGQANSTTTTTTISVPVTDTNVIVLMFVTINNVNADNLLIGSASHVKSYNQISYFYDGRNRGWITFVPDGTGIPTFTTAHGQAVGSSSSGRYTPYLVFKPVEG